MQVMPGTWDYVQQNLATRQLNPNSATDNVHRRRALPAVSLLNQTGGDESAAIAAYYQGLGALRSRGVFDDTAQVRRQRPGAARPLRRLSCSAYRSAAGSSRRGPSCYARCRGHDRAHRRPDLPALAGRARAADRADGRARRASASRRARTACSTTRSRASSTQIQLAERCALDKTTMVVTVDELETAGLAERRPSPTDRRARIIAVTEAGARDGRARATRSSHGIYADVLDSLPDDERDAVRRRAARGSSTGASPHPPACDATGAPPRAADRSELDRLLTDHLLRSSCVHEQEATSMRPPPATPAGSPSWSSARGC